MYMCTYCHQKSPYSTVITQVSFPHYSSSTVVIADCSETVITVLY